ncbi:MAG: bifunctional 3-deoxy-7-phosphoheptulonate synthase/chorismate mutase type II [Alistipes sp.]|nr:bifunctional 3-deoxy-7-phosphoheptulonate synthase/chorismate mutase type II [Alistipes sp.]
MKDIKPLFDDCATTPLYIAGPCSAESREQTLAAARGVAQAGVKIFRAGVWKPRTKPGSFEGVGAEALEWIAEAKQQYGLHTLTEIATPEHLEEALRSGVDGVWIGARTTTNPFAMQEIADALRGVDTAVLVKNPVIPDVALWIGSIERVYNSGVRRLAAVHRGFGTYDMSVYRNSPHWSVPIELRRRLPQLPLLSDPSHIGGNRCLVATLAQEALDLGFDGLMIESHPTPDEALSDANQQITPESLATLVENLVWRRSATAKDGLRDFRLHIDSLDNRLLELLAERMGVAREIGEYKRAHSMAVVQQDRFNELLQAAETRAENMGLSRKFIHNIFSAIHEESVRQQIEEGGADTMK